MSGKYFVQIIKHCKQKYYSIWKCNTVFCATVLQCFNNMWLYFPLKKIANNFRDNFLMQVSTTNCEFEPQVGLLCIITLWCWQVVWIFLFLISLPSLLTAKQVDYQFQTLKCILWPIRIMYSTCLSTFVKYLVDCFVRCQHITIHNINHDHPNQYYYVL